MRFRHRFGSRLSGWLLAALAVAAIVPSMASAKMLVKEIPGIENARLTGVSCPAWNECTAVGYGGGSTLAVRWNGSTWSTQTTQNVGIYGSRLYGVSCPTSTFCVAVGNWYLEKEPNPLVEVWKGAKWEVPETYLVDRSWTELKGVSCRSNIDCIAAGSTGTGKAKRAVLYKWLGSGSHWLDERVGPEEVTSSLNGISCSHEGECSAVGSLGNTSSEVLAVTGNWGPWHTGTVPLPEERLIDPLQGVTCWSTNKCQAVGATGLGKYAPLIESWNGSEWSQASNSSTNGFLYSVSCVTEPTREQPCYAVGIEGTKPLVERQTVFGWEGDEAATPAGSTKATLLGVSDLSSESGFAVAVGYYLNSEGREIPFAEEGS